MPHRRFVPFEKQRCLVSNTVPAAKHSVAEDLAHEGCCPTKTALGSVRSGEEGSHGTGVEPHKGGEARTPGTQAG